MLKLMLGTVLLAGAMPAAAAVVGFANVDVTRATTFSVGNAATFRFSYDPVAAAGFNPDTYAVRTGGTGQTSAFGGFLGIPLQPSTFFTGANVTIDNNLFPSFAAFPTATPIPYSLVAGDLALRYTVGSDSFFGYARLNGDSTLDFAFENTANTAIVAGSAITGPGGISAAIPEPAAWALLLTGFGLAGASLRRRRTKAGRPTSVFA